MIIEYVHRNKFQNELQNASIDTIAVSAIDDSEIGCKVIFVDGTDMELVQQIITAHDPTPLPSKPTEAERIEMLEDTVNFLLGL